VKSDLAALGVRRIRLGGTIARGAWTRGIRAAPRIATAGQVSTALPAASPNAELNGFFSDEMKRD